MHILKTAAEQQAEQSVIIKVWVTHLVHDSSVLRCRVLLFRAWPGRETHSAFVFCCHFCTYIIINMIDFTLAMIAFSIRRTQLHSPGEIGVCNLWSTNAGIAGKLKEVKITAFASQTPHECINLTYSAAREPKTLTLRGRHAPGRQWQQPLARSIWNASKVFSSEFWFLSSKSVQYA